MHIIFMIIVLYTFLNTFESIYFINNGETYFGANLRYTWLLYIFCIVVAVANLLFRKYIQNKYSKMVNENITSIANENEFFYQLPIVQLTDDMPIRVNGKSNITFQLYFNNIFHKFLFIFDLFSIPGLLLISEENQICLKSRGWLKYKYDIYINECYKGTFNAKSLLKKEGIKKYINFLIQIDNKEYELTNDYLDLTAYIKEETILLSGKRTYFNFFSKNEKNGRRGEKHIINVDPNLKTEKKELFLALYITALNIRNF